MRAVEVRREEAMAWKVRWVEATIRARDYPPELEKEIFDLADRILSTHARFLTAKSSPPGAYEEFCKNLEAGSP